MNTEKTQSQAHFKHYKLSILVLFVLYNFSSTLLAIETNQKLIEENESIKGSFNDSWVMTDQIMFGNDLIFQSSFEFCSSQPPILNGIEDFSIKLVLGAPFNQPGSPSNPLIYDGTYNDIAPGSNDWPGVYGTQGYMTLSKNRYAAMQFNTDSSNEKAKFVFTTPGNGQGPPTNATTVSISTCPGDFTTHLNQSRCLAVGGATPNIRWSLDPNTNPATHCLLEKNRTYYLNIVHSNSTEDGYSTSACTGASYCGIIFNQTSENN